MLNTKNQNIMTTTTKNRNNYKDVFVTPCYLIRKKLEEDYQYSMNFRLLTAGIISLFADHLTAYNELVSSPIFFRMRYFEPLN